MNTITDDQIAEIEALAGKATPGQWWIDSHGHNMVSLDDYQPIFSAKDLIKPAVRHPETGNLSHWPNDWDASYIATANPAKILALIARLREAERWKADASQVLNPLFDYAHSLGLAKLGHSVTEALVEDHKRLREAERDAARYRWIAGGCVGHWLGEEGPVLVHAKPWNENWRAEIDAAIDAAMQEAEQ